MPFAKPQHITIDFETRSHADIKKVGSWIYSRHPTTEVMCLVYKIDNGPKRLWHMAHDELFIDETPAPQELFDAIAAGARVEAHNALFEQAIWINVCVPRMGWPAVPKRQWRCSAAKASAHALPRALEDACAVMNLPVQKDMVGNKVMKKLSKPVKKTGTYPEPTIAELRALWDYCGTDVDAEYLLSQRLDDLTPLEQEMWFMDQDVNMHGVRVDVYLAEVALKLADEIKRKNNVRFAELTGLKTTGQRAAIVSWCNDNGVDLPNMKAETVDEVLSRADLPELVREVLTLVRQSGRTSTRKYDAIRKLADEDGRVRGSLVYCGAERTGRWAGRGMQPHNFPRGTIKNMMQACDLILEQDLEWLEALYKDVMEFLSHALRGAITASPGRHLFVADFAAIEARVLFWLAGQDDALELLRKGECIYCDMATVIYEFKVVKGVHIAERQMGKQAILGLGFGMGAPKFVETCEKYQIPVTDKLADGVVKKYRGKYTKVPEFWRLQEAAAINAMMYAGTGHMDFDKWFYEAPFELGMTVDDDGWVYAGMVAWRYDGEFFLRCKLPSGRCLVYPGAQLGRSTTYYFKSVTAQGSERWMTLNNDDGADWPAAKIVHEGKKKARKMRVKLVNENFFSKQNYKLKYQGRDKKATPIAGGPKVHQWGWIHTYSGKITENIVQAVARDLMAESMLRVHRHELYDVVLSVHDELIAEEDEFAGDLHEFEQLVAQTPEWAEGCPVGAEGWHGFRYRK